MHRDIYVLRVFSAVPPGRRPSTLLPSVRERCSEHSLTASELSTHVQCAHGVRAYMFRVAYA